MTMTNVVMSTSTPSMNLHVKGRAIRNVQTDDLLSSATPATPVHETLRRDQSMINVMMAITRSVCVARESKIARSCPEWTTLVFLYGTLNGVVANSYVH